ncbi:MAG: hypothetical protein ACK4TF_04800 [Thermodesulfovibrionales bacterium]
MGVGIAFLRPKADGSWEGDYTSAGRGTFSGFQDLLLSLPGCFLLPAFREEEYDIETAEGGPPYPARVSPELAKDLMEWIEDDARRLLEELRHVPQEEVDEFVWDLKSLIEQRLAEGYAIMVSY